MLATMYPPVVPIHVTSPFGWRTHPITGIRQFHNGTDLSAPNGTPIHAAWAGTAYPFADEVNGNGLRIIHDLADTGGIASSGYAHLAGYAPGIGPGVTVRRGQIIGYVGSTGRSTGPHLHFVLRGSAPQPDGEGIPRIELNPAPYLARAYAGGATSALVLIGLVAALALVLWLLT